MKHLISIRLPFAAIPKGRPRATRSGHVFTPARTRTFERDVSKVLSAAYRSLPVKCAVHLDFIFSFARPKKPSRPYPGRSDLDNLIKGICDSANKILFDDDSQVVSISARKQYADADAIALVMWSVVSTDTEQPKPIGL